MYIISFPFCGFQKCSKLQKVHICPMSRRHVAGKREGEGKEARERWRGRERRYTEPFKGEIGEFEMRRKGRTHTTKKDAKAPISRLER